MPYRYLICTLDTISGNIHVRRWETHLVPREVAAFPHDESIVSDGHDGTAADGDASNIRPRSTQAPDIDTFGDIAGVEKIDRGWLTTETILQFKFIKNPFVLKQKLKNKLLYVKVSILNGSFRN